MNIKSLLSLFALTSSQVYGFPSQISTASLAKRDTSSIDTGSEFRDGVPAGYGDLDFSSRAFYIKIPRFQYENWLPENSYKHPVVRNIFFFKNPPVDIKEQVRRAEVLVNQTLQGVLDYPSMELLRADVPNEMVVALPPLDNPKRGTEEVVKALHRDMPGVATQFNIQHQLAGANFRMSIQNASSEDYYWSPTSYKRGNSEKGPRRRELNETNPATWTSIDTSKQLKVLVDVDGGFPLQSKPDHRFLYLDIGSLSPTANLLFRALTVVLYNDIFSAHRPDGFKDPFSHLNTSTIEGRIVKGILSSDGVGSILALPPPLRNETIPSNAELKKAIILPGNDNSENLFSPQRPFIDMTRIPAPSEQSNEESRNDTRWGRTDVLKSVALTNPSAVAVSADYGIESLDSLRRTYMALVESGIQQDVDVQTREKAALLLRFYNAMTHLLSRIGGESAALLFGIGAIYAKKFGRPGLDRFLRVTAAISKALTQTLLVSRNGGLMPMIGGSLVLDLFGQLGMSRSIPMLLSAPMGSPGAANMLYELGTTRFRDPTKWVNMGWSIAGAASVSLVKDAILLGMLVSGQEDVRREFLQREMGPDFSLVQMMLRHPWVKAKFPELANVAERLSWGTAAMLNGIRLWANVERASVQNSGITAIQQKADWPWPEQPPFSLGVMALPKDLTKLWRWDKATLESNSDFQDTADAIGLIPVVIGDIRLGVVGRIAKDWLSDGFSTENLSKFELQAREAVRKALVDYEANPKNDAARIEYERLRDNYRAVLALSFACRAVTGITGFARGTALGAYQRNPEEFTQWFRGVLEIASKDAGFLIKAGEILHVVGRCYAAFSDGFDDVESLFYRRQSENGVLSLSKAIAWKRKKWFQETFGKIAFVTDKESSGRDTDVHVIFQYFERVGNGKLGLSLDTDLKSKRFAHLVSDDEVDVAGKIMASLLTGKKDPDTGKFEHEILLDQLKKEALDRLDEQEKSKHDAIADLKDKLGQLALDRLEAEKKGKQDAIDELDKSTAAYEAEKAILDNDCTQILLRKSQVTRTSLTSLTESYTSELVLERCFEHVFKADAQQINNNRTERERANRREWQERLDESQQQENAMKTALRKPTSPQEVMAEFGKKASELSQAGDDGGTSLKLAIEVMQRKVMPAFMSGKNEDRISKLDAEMEEAFKSLSTDDLATANETYRKYRAAWNEKVDYDKRYRDWIGTPDGKKYLEVREKCNDEIERLDDELQEIRSDYREFLSIVKKYEAFNDLLEGKLRKIGKTGQYPWQPFSEHSDALDLSDLSTSMHDAFVADLNQEELRAAKRAGITMVRLQGGEVDSASPWKRWLGWGRWSGGKRRGHSEPDVIELKDVKVGSADSLRNLWVRVTLAGLSSERTPSTDDIRALEDALVRDMGELMEAQADAYFPAKAATNGQPLGNCLVAKVEPDGNTWIASIDDAGGIQLFKTETKLYKETLKAGERTQSDFEALRGPVVHIIDYDEYAKEHGGALVTHRVPEWRRMTYVEQIHWFKSLAWHYDYKVAAFPEGRGARSLAENIRLEINRGLRAGKETIVIDRKTVKLEDVAREMDDAWEAMGQAFEFPQPALRGINLGYIDEPNRSAFRQEMREGAVVEEPTYLFGASEVTTPLGFAQGLSRPFGTAAREVEKGQGVLQHLFVPFRDVSHYRDKVIQAEGLSKRKTEIETFLWGFDPIQNISHTVRGVPGKVNPAQVIEAPAPEYLDRLGNLIAGRWRSAASSSVGQNDEDLATLRVSLPVILGGMTPYETVEFLSRADFRKDASKDPKIAETHGALKAELRTVVETSVYDRLVDAVSAHCAPLDEDARQRLYDAIVLEFNPVACLYPEAYATYMASQSEDFRKHLEEETKTGRRVPFTRHSATILLDENLQHVADEELRAELKAYIDNELPHIGGYLLLLDGSELYSESSKLHKILALVESFISKRSDVKDALKPMMKNLERDVQKVAKHRVDIEETRFLGLLERNGVKLLPDADRTQLLEAAKKALVFIDSPDGAKTLMEIVRPHLGALDLVKLNRGLEEESREWRSEILDRQLAQMTPEAKEKSVSVLATTIEDLKLESPDQDFQIFQRVLQKHEHSISEETSPPKLTDVADPEPDKVRPFDEILKKYGQSVSKETPLSLQLTEIAGSENLDKKDKLHLMDILMKSAEFSSMEALPKVASLDKPKDRSGDQEQKAEKKQEAKGEKAVPRSEGKKNVPMPPVKARGETINSEVIDSIKNERMVSDVMIDVHFNHLNEQFKKYHPKIVFLHTGEAARLATGSGEEALEGARRIQPDTEYVVIPLNNGGFREIPGKGRTFDEGTHWTLGVLKIQRDANGRSTLELNCLDTKDFEPREGISAPIRNPRSVEQKLANALPSVLEELWERDIASCRVEYPGAFNQDGLDQDKLNQDRRNQNTLVCALTVNGMAAEIIPQLAASIDSGQTHQFTRIASIPERDPKRMRAAALQFLTSQFGQSCFEPSRGYRSPLETTLGTLVEGAFRIKRLDYPFQGTTVHKPKRAMYVNPSDLQRKDDGTLEWTADALKRRVDAGASSETEDTDKLYTERPLYRIGADEHPIVSLAQVGSTIDVERGYAMRPGERKEDAPTQGSRSGAKLDIKFAFSPRHATGSAPADNTNTDVKLPQQSQTGEIGSNKSLSDSFADLFSTLETDFSKPTLNRSLQHKIFGISDDHATEMQKIAGDGKAYEMRAAQNGDGVCGRGFLTPYGSIVFQRNVSASSPPGKSDEVTFIVVSEKQMRDSELDVDEIRKCVQNNVVVVFAVKDPQQRSQSGPRSDKDSGISIGEEEELEGMGEAEKPEGICAPDFGINRKPRSARDVWASTVNGYKQAVNTVTSSSGKAKATGEYDATEQANLTKYCGKRPFSPRPEVVTRLEDIDKRAVAVGKRSDGSWLFANRGVGTVTVQLASADLMAGKELVMGKSLKKTQGRGR